MIQHRDIFNTVRDAIFIADTDTGMIVDANRAAETLCGRSLEELRSMHHTRLHPPEVEETARLGFQKDRRIPGLTEGRILHRDGRRIPVEIASSHFTDADGRRMLVGIFRDITERARARESLRHSEERFRQVAESAGEFIWEVDAAGLYVFASPIVERILGYAPEEVVGRMHFYDFFVPETREAITKAAFDVFARKEPFRAFLNWNLRRDGTMVALETSGLPILDGNGNLLGYRGADTDVTGRMRTEAALRESEDLYRTLFDQSADCVFLLDPGAGLPVIVAANEAALQSHGYSREEMIGQPISLIEPGVSQESLDARMRLIAEGKPFYTVHRRKDGSTYEVESVARPVRIGAQEMVLALGRNITERKRAEQELLRRNEFIRAALDNISDGVVACDADGILALFNRAAREWHGVDALELPPDQWSSHYDLFGADGHTPLATDSIPLKRAFNGEHIRHVGMTIAAKGQPLRHLLASGRPFYDHDGNKLGAVVAMHDVTEQKRAEEALRESEERFRVTFEQAAIGIAHVATDGRFLRVNQRFCQIVGYSQEEMRERTFQAITHPADLDADVEQMHLLLSGKIHTYTMEKRYLRKDGRQVWVDLTVAPVRNRSGHTEWFVSAVQDITNRKQAEASLRESEERLRASEARLRDAQRLAKVGSWEREPATGKICWSEEVLRIWGLSQVPTDFQALIGHIHPRDRERFVEAYRKVLSNSAPAEIEYRVTRPDGEVRSVHSIVETIRNDRGAPVRIVGASQDITERVRASELLRESEDRLKHAERIAHVGHWQWDVKTNVVSWSEEAFRIFGRPPDYTPGYRGFLDAIVPEDRERVDGAIRHCLEVKKGHSIEFRLSRPNGEIRTVAGTSELLLDEDGSVAQVFGTTQDITESKQAQEEAVKRQKLESVGTLANGMAHDFNNLLGGVLAHAELALVEMAAGSHPEEEIKAIREAAIRGSEIVRQLMIYAGTENEVLNSIDLSRIVEEMVDLLKFSVSKHATLITHLGKDLPAVQASSGQLRQIVMNLVTNASEAIGEHDGVIRVTTEWVNVGRNRPGFVPEDCAEGDYLKLEVSDTGCGMPVEIQARVFDPFFSTKSAGHGLGLAVVQGTVRSLRGTIRVESEPGKGTTFEILLPCTRTPLVAARGPKSAAGEPASPWKQATVLVVEDEDSLRLPVSKLMRKAGFSVIEAADGSAALDLIRAHESPIDVLFLDITLPGAPSREVFEEAGRLRRDMSVIVTSAYSRDLAEERLGGKIERFLRKPYQLNDLIDLVRQTLL